MKDLVIALYALLIIYQGQPPSKELFAALKSPTLKKFKDELPSLASVCAGFMKADLDFGTLGDELRAFVMLYKKDEQSRASVAKLLSAFAAWIRTDSVGAFSFIEKMSASTVFPTWVSGAFVKDLGDQSKVKKTLKTLVKKMTGREAIGFASPEEAAAAKEKDLETYKAYLRARKEFTDIWKTFLSNVVRGSGKKTMPYVKVLKEMAAAGVEHNLPDGFTGNIDAVGKWYSQYDELLGSTPPQKNMFPRVKMNPAYTEGSPVWVFQAMREDGTPGNYGYTLAAVKRTVADKFQKVRDFVPMVPKIRAKWVAQIKTFDRSNPANVACVVLELLYQTMARIGGSTAFGMAVLLKKHYAPSVGGFTLKYLGKDEVPTKHVIKGNDPLSKLIVKIVAELAADKKPNDPLFSFTSKSGVEKRITPALVNAVFRRMGASGVSVHKLRTYHGTRIFQEEVAKIYKKYPTVKTPQQAMELLKLAATVVGKNLNHVRTTKDGSTQATPATAISAYIDFSAQIAFFVHYRMPLPKHLEGHLVKSSLRVLSAASAAEQAPVVNTEKTEMKEVPEPVGKSDEVKKPEKEDDEDSAVLPQFSDDSPDPDPTDDELVKEQDAEDVAQNKARKVLEKQAEKYSYLLTYGGEEANFALGEGKLDNVLVEERFKGTEAP